MHGSLAPARTDVRPLVAFLLIAFAVTLIDVLLLRFGPSGETGYLAAAVSIDLTVGLVAAGWVCLVRLAGWPLVVLVPVLLFSVALASQVVPPQQHQLLDGIGLVAQTAEIGLVAFGVWKVVTVVSGARGAMSATGGDVLTALRTSLARNVGPRVAGILATEMAVVVYGFGGWFQKARPPRGATVFSTAGGWLPILVAITMILVVETFAAHLIVSLVAPAAAWVFTAVSAYSLLWLLADGHAARLRPILVTDTDLIIRIGLRWTVSVPRAQILSVGPVRRAADTSPGLVLAMDGQPTVEVLLREPVAVDGPFGIERRADRLAIGVDDPSGFIAALSADADSRPMGT